MRLLVIGSGGREHALVWKLAQSPKVDKIYCIPGNPGIAQIAECAAVDTGDNEAVYRFVADKSIDLTVVGPEAPLANGIVDFLTVRGCKIFGPSQAAAEIEGSKAFAKKLMRKYGIPTADFEVFDDPESARKYVLEKAAPIVVKADGLAAGKGVIVAATTEEALTAVETIMQAGAFGAAGSRIVIEEYMAGEEASLLAFTDGYTVLPMVPAQDHKRIYDNDKGPNTGGMGAYAPAPVMTRELIEQTVREILQPAVDAMRAEGKIYKGCLYAGLMITQIGPKVVEFNARFGDPETQVVLPLLDSDLVTVMEACIDGRLDKVSVKWKPDAAVCVVLAAAGYPGRYRKGDPIEGLDAAVQKGALLFHAGTARHENRLVVNGGRVIGVTAVAGDIAAAVAKVYAGIGEISFDGMHYRRDIARRALNREIR